MSQMYLAMPDQQLIAHVVTTQRAVANQAVCCGGLQGVETQLSMVVILVGTSRRSSDSNWSRVRAGAVGRECFFTAGLLAG